MSKFKALFFLYYTSVTFSPCLWESYFLFFDARKAYYCSIRFQQLLILSLKGENLEGAATSFIFGNQGYIWLQGYCCRICSKKSVRLQSSMYFFAKIESFLLFLQILFYTRALKSLKSLRRVSENVLFLFGEITHVKAFCVWKYFRNLLWYARAMSELQLLHRFSKK